jgi:hypothetical protein
MVGEMLGVRVSIPDSDWLVASESGGGGGNSGTFEYSKSESKKSCKFEKARIQRVNLKKTSI